MSMDSVIALFNTHQDIILQYRYLILMCVLVLEGTATMLATGALIATGFFDVVPALFVCIFAEIVDGFIWYSVGYIFGSKPIDWFIRNSPGRQAFMAAIRKHADRSAGLVVLLVKMTYSITNATLVLVGSLKYDVRRFAVVNVIGSIGWAALLLSLGYSFGHTALAYLPGLRLIGLTVFFVIVSVIALLLLKHFGDVLIRRVRRAS